VCGCGYVRRLPVLSQRLRLPVLMLTAYLHYSDDTADMNMQICA
jgi:hypothetical protein